MIVATACAISACVAVDLTRAAWFDAAGTCAALAAALVVGRRPEQRRMALLILLWVLAGALADVSGGWPGAPAAVTVWLLARSLQAPAYAQMALAYPSGRVIDRLERAFLAVAYPVSLLWGLIPALFGLRSLIFVGHAFDLGPSADAFAVAFMTLGAAFIALVVRRLRRCPPGARRTLLPLAAAGCFAAADFILLRAAWLTGWSAALAPLDRLDTANLVVLPAAIVIGLAWIHRDRGPLGDLMVELAEARPGQVRGALARAVGDPSLELALWLPDRRRFVSEDGEPITPAADRAVTFVGRNAAVVHDPALSGQRPLLEAAGAAARLALENARLNAELRAQLAELRESRARIVAAGDAERRRLERDLHDGAQQRLLALGLALQLLHDGRADRKLLDDAETELQAALHELRELARGIHPAILGRSRARRRHREPAGPRAAADPSRRRPRPLSPGGRDRRLLRRLRGAGQHHQARAGALGERVDRQAERPRGGPGQRRRPRRRRPSLRQRPARPAGPRGSARRPLHDRHPGRSRDHDPSRDPMRVVVADDSALIRDGLRQLLPAHGFEIAATAADVAALLRAIERTRPEVALVDIRMPPTYSDEGLTAAATIRELHPQVGVLVLSQYVDADYALTLIRAHPTHCGYLLKDRITQISVLADRDAPRRER